MVDLLKLSSELLISSGDNRHCYIHPVDPNKCIKVLRPDTPAKVNMREKRYYEVLLKRGISWERLAQYYGTEQTTQGEGLVFELVRDDDGSISKTLDYYLNLNDDQINDEIVRQIDLLQNYFMHESIVFRDLITLNILMKKKSVDDYDLIVIDGIGHNDALRFCEYSKSVARRKIKRIWNRKKSKWFDPYPKIKNRIRLYD